jgi:hypothetical protein
MNSGRMYCFRCSGFFLWHFGQRGGGIEGLFDSHFLDIIVEGPTLEPANYE